MKQKIIAIFMLSIVLIMPIYSAIVYAGLSNLYVRGGDDIEGYIRRNDFVQFTVTASIDGDEITPNQVVLKNVKAFDSCASGTSGYDCDLRIPETGTKSFTPTSIPFTIDLYNDDNNLVDSLSSQIIVDNKAPKVKSFSITPEVTSTGTVSLNYNIEDYAYTNTYTGKCSGIEKIEFYENDFSGNLLDTETLATANCAVSGVKEYTTSATGEVKICAKAYDRFMQESTQLKCDTFTIDNVAPAIDANSFRVLYRNREMYYFKDTAINVVVSVNITAPDLNLDDVFADMSALNPGQSGYDNLKATCTNLVNDVSECKWYIALKPADTGTASVVVKAKDLVGNELTETISRTFTKDITGPIVTSLFTGISSGGNYYVGLRGDITAEFNEDVGVNPDDMLLHIGTSVLPATNCTAGWSCLWSNLNFNQVSGTIKASIGTDSKDILGNHVSEEFSIDIIVDKTPPTDINVTVYVIGGTLPPYEGYAKTGDSFQIIANLSDTVLAEAYADLSAFITGADHVDGECTTENETIVCVWNTAPIDISGYINDDIILYFVDITGNEKIVREKMTVYGLIDEENPNYWKNSVDCMPSKVDRQVSSLMSQRVYCHVKLSALSGTPMVMEMDIGECRSSYEEDSMSYVESLDIMNNILGSTNPYLKFTLKKGPLQIDRLGMNCDLKIKSKVGNEITSNYEIENVSITIPLYNMPLGELSKSTQEKIDDAKNHSLVNSEWIGTLNSIFDFANTVCSGVQTLNNIATAWKSLGLLTSGVENALYDSVAGAAAAAPVSAMRIGEQSIAEFLDVATKESWVEFANPFCKAISCRLFYDEAWTALEDIGGYQRKILEVADDIATLGGLTGIKAYAYEVGMDETGFEQHLEAKLNPRESIVLSGLTLCLPGVIYNLEKLRQIDCMYVDCLQTYAEQGLPLRFCEEQKSYGTCKYWTGELFQLIPIAPLLDSLVGLIKQALSSPFGIVDIGMGFMCASLIAVPHNGIAANLCLINNIIGLGTDVYEDIFGANSLFSEDKWKIQGDYCGRIDENE